MLRIVDLGRLGVLRNHAARILLFGFVYPNYMGLVYVVGYFGASNLGDDLLLVESMKQILKEISNSQVVIVSHPNKYLASYFPNSSQITPSYFLRSKLRDGDKIVFAGGGQFSNFEKPKLENLWGFSDFLSILGVRFIIWRWLNKVKGFPYLIGVGPARGVGARFGSKLLRLSLEKGSVRDTTSQKHLSNCIVGADPVLATFELNLELISRSNDSPKKIGILLRNWDEPSSVINFSKNLVDFLFQKGFNSSQIEFISFQKDYDQDVYKDPFFNQFDLLSWSPENKTITTFIAQLARFSHIFSMRAHGIFLAARLGSNVTPVVIEPKILIASEQVGLRGQHLSLKSGLEEFARINLFNSSPDVKSLTGMNNTNANDQLRNFLRS